MATPTDNRPDPDALLRQVQADEARARRGRLKIFFGASAGVGKTYAMLAGARAALARGTPVRVGLVETHGRVDTEAMLEPLPRLPLREVTHKGQVLREFDLDGALAFAAEQPRGDDEGPLLPPLVLVDELAHTNAPDSRHPKRWQDVEELLDAGVDVWSTMNVQHLESLNDIVGGITGVRVWETVPDRVFDQADEVVVVDLPPDELLERLKAGKVYVPEQAQRAAANFFRKGNLLALRELALRRTADRVDNQMQAWRRRVVQPGTGSVWPNREALLACVGPGPHSEKVVRSCARLAAQLDVAWHAVHVDTPALRNRPQSDRQRPLEALKLAERLGAQAAVLSAPDASPALVRHAREHNLSRLVLGRHERRWPWPRSLADRLLAEADDLDVLQVALPATPFVLPMPATPARNARPVAAARRAWWGYAVALGACGLAALGAAPLSGVLELSNIVMLFLLAVVGTALLVGRGPAVLAAFIGVGLFDFFFVEPQFSFAVSDVQYLVTFAVMLFVALVIGQLTAGLKVQAESAMQREHRVRSLYAMARDLSAALLPEQVAEIGGRFVQAEFEARSALVAADEHDRLQLLPGATAAVDMAVVQWAFDRGQRAGRGTDTLPGSHCLVLPLKAPMRLRGVLVIETNDGSLTPEQQQLLDTCASLLAISLERIHYIDVAQTSTVQIESERLRNSLLSAISHDLRTPLASLVGMADALALTRPAPSAQQHEFVDAIRQAALRMSALVNNLLDMARLEAGSVQLRREWQPLEEVVGSALAACAAPLAGRDVRIELAPDLPLLQFDAVLIERVLVNLLENAAKYTPAGSPITLAARPDGDDARIVVEDNGPGLPPGREDALFEKFERGTKEAAVPGVGLGLAICRAILQAHGGSIVGENRPTKPDGQSGGARFVLRLPLGQPPADDGSTQATLDAEVTP